MVMTLCNGSMHDQRVDDLIGKSRRGRGVPGACRPCLEDGRQCDAATEPSLLRLVRRRGHVAR